MRVRMFRRSIITRKVRAEIILCEKPSWKTLMIYPARRHREDGKAEKEGRERAASKQSGIVLLDTVPTSIDPSEYPTGAIYQSG